MDAPRLPRHDREPDRVDVARIDSSRRPSLGFVRWLPVAGVLAVLLSLLLLAVLHGGSDRGRPSLPVVTHVGRRGISRPRHGSAARRVDRRGVVERHLQPRVARAHLTVGPSDVGEEPAATGRPVPQPPVSVPAPRESASSAKREVNSSAEAEFGFER